MEGNRQGYLYFFVFLFLLTAERGKHEARGKIKKTSQYLTGKRFLESQLDDPGSELNELIILNLYGIPDTLKYFGVGKYDGKPKNQKSLAEEERLLPETIGNRTNSLLCYLGCPGKWGKRTRQIAERIKRRVEKERKERIEISQEDEKARERYEKAKSLGLPYLPIGMLDEKLENLTLIVEAQKSGKIDESNPKHQILLMLYGLNRDRELRCLSMRRIVEMTGRCMATISRWEMEALSELGR